MKGTKGWRRRWRVGRAEAEPEPCLLSFAVAAASACAVCGLDYGVGRLEKQACEMGMGWDDGAETSKEQ